MTEIEEITKALARAMEAKRAELINLPLANIWQDLAVAAIDQLDALGARKSDLTGLISGDLRTCDGYCQE